MIKKLFEIRFVKIPYLDTNLVQLRFLGMRICEWEYNQFNETWK
jgi:hypothetical protein